MGPAAGRLRRHDRPLRHHDARATCRASRSRTRSRSAPSSRATSPPAALRYWRGPVLWDFDGRTWSIGAELPGATSPRRAAGAPPTATRWCSSRTTATGCSRSRPRPALPDARAHELRRPARVALAGARALRYELASVIAPQPERAGQPGRAAPRAAPAAGLQPARERARRAVARASRPSDGEVLERAIEFLRAGPLRVHARAAAARRATRSTSSCSAPRQASASTSPRRSCS